ncbi:cytochrome P450 71A1-like isoform X2 [Quercus lobata]|uniref:cytochrome P450 71A1-like isoform X2 n=1 Tax=Quercus lobata TaxID=97700 RepID=UPI0012467510|nr:cytochrome P450 71A1-like isoform X2 [Quercus lobata]
MAVLQPLLQQSWQELHKMTFTLLLPLLFLFSFLYVFKCIRNSEKPNLPPSPPKLPIIGNLHQLGSLPHRSLHALSKKYGPLMFLYFGHAPSLVVSSADMAREMMTTHDKVFSNRPKTIATNFLLYGCIDLAFSPYGEYWRKVRKVCVHDLLSIKRVQSLHYVREEEVAILMNKFEEQDGMGKPSELPRKVMVLIASFFWGDFFPSLGWIDILTGLLPSLKSTGREIDAYLDEVLEEHYKTAKCDDDEHLNKKDFVDIFLQLQKDGMLGFELHHENLKAILLNMLIGGGDSTSTTLEWVMAELIKNPSIMKRAQEEVRRVVGNKSKIDVDDISQMNYMKCIIKESLRLHTPLPLSAPRETSESVKFGGYDIPAKTRVFVNVWAIQRDPKLWDRPEEFIPERFIDNPNDLKGQNFEFVPFGGGRKGCPGMAFAVAAVEYLLANLLCWFDWRLPTINAQGEELDMTEVNALTAFRKNRLHIVPILHSS